MPERTHKDPEIPPTCATSELQVVFTDLADDLAISPAELEAIERLLGGDFSRLLST